MAYTISEQLIPFLPHNAYRHGVGKPEGIVLHATDNYEATALNNHVYESRTWKSAFVHFFVDWTDIIQNADTNYIAYGAGPVANQRFIHIELCCTKDKAKFKAAYDRFAWLVAKLLHQYGLKPARRQTLWTHHDVTSTLGGTTHSDPDGYLKYHGYTVDQLISDITKAYNGSSSVSNTVKQSVKSSTIYRVRKSADDVKSQIGAFKDEDNAIDIAKKHKGYGVFDEKGNKVYPSSSTTVSKPESKPTVKKTVVSKKSLVPYPGRLIKIGSKGKDVQRVQNAVGVKADGVFGPQTKKAVQAYQKRHGLVADGIVGKNTWSVMF